MRNCAIVLAGGSGSRMKSSVKKQYLLMQGRPVLCYALDAFEACPQIQEIILVCGAGEEDQCRTQIVDPYGYRKITQIVPGGKERYHSVYEGLKAAGECEYILIHDGARPFVDAGIIERSFNSVEKYKACVAAVPVKDTIKLSTADGFVDQTPPRELLWTIQTPQSFTYALIKGAYDKLMSLEGKESDLKITDDAMVAETFADVPVRLVEGSYENIKITTPDDLLMADLILRRRATVSE